jgi:hypothetical protein
VLLPTMPCYCRPTPRHAALLLEDNTMPCCSTEDGTPLLHLSLALAGRPWSHR